MRSVTSALGLAAPAYTRPSFFMSIVHTPSCPPPLFRRSSKTPFVWATSAAHSKPKAGRAYLLHERGALGGGHARERLRELGEELGRLRRALSGALGMDSGIERVPGSPLA
jgi:hypothetical protein